MLYIRREEQGNRKNAAKFIRDEARGKEKIQTTGRRKGSPFIFKNIETKNKKLPSKIIVLHSLENIG